MSGAAPRGSSRRSLLERTASASASPPLSPNDHLRLLVELLRPAGPDLARRWLAALLLAPESDRLAIVESVEKRMVETYADAPASTSGAVPGAVTVRTAPAQREGFVEQTVVTYERAAPTSPKRPQARRKAAGDRPPPV